MKSHFLTSKSMSRVATGRRLHIARFFMCLVLGHSNVAFADTIFYDDFSDGSHEDGTPISWVAPWGSPSLYVSTGEGFVVSGSTLPAAVTSNFELSDMSIRTQLRLTEGGLVGISGRAGQSPHHGNYYVYIGTTTVGLDISLNDVIDNLVEVPMVIETRQHDVMIQLDLFGDSLDFWVWPANELMPLQPTGSAVDDSIQEGSVALYVGSENYPDAGPASATFRFVHVADTHIPATTADFDFDGDVDGVDFLTWQNGFGLQSGASLLDGDADGDGDVDGNDFLIWQTAFGSGSGFVNAAVPEPAAVILLLVALVGAIVSVRRCSKHEL